MMSLQHSEGMKLVEEGRGYQPVDVMHREEVAIIDGALSYREMQVSEVMTPIKDTFMIAAAECLSYKVAAKPLYCHLQINLSSRSSDSRSVVGNVVVEDTRIWDTIASVDIDK